MATELRVPAVGESISEVVVGQWLKKVGERVEIDDPVVEIDTDKVSTEILANVAGVIQAIRANSGDTLKVGDVIAVIGDGAGVAPAPVAAPAPVPAPAPTPAPAPNPAPAAPTVMPAAAREMAASGVPLSAVTPTGPGGRVLKEDVQRASPQKEAVHSPPTSVGQAPAAPIAGVSKSSDPAPAAAAPGARGEHVVKMTPLRKRIAARLVEAQSTAAILTTFNEVDMAPIMDFRKKNQDAFVARHGVKLGFMSVFVRAAVDALRLVPEVNAAIRGDEIVYRDYCDIGVAVGGGKGLVVPVIRNAERLGFAEIEKVIADFGKRARENKLGLEDLSGGTFTISNGGVYGSLMSTPIINPPQSGILGMHAINDRPMAVDGQVVIRPMMYIALSYDHRIIDGREAVTFLKRIKECVENPARMLFEV